MDAGVKLFYTASVSSIFRKNTCHHKCLCHEQIKFLQNEINITLNIYSSKQINKSKIRKNIHSRVPLKEEKLRDH